VALQVIDSMQVWYAEIWEYDNKLGRDMLILADTDIDEQDNPNLHIWVSVLSAPDVLAHEAMHAIKWPEDPKYMSHAKMYGGRTMAQWEMFCTT
jgi:hypothetical protein